MKSSLPDTWSTCSSLLFPCGPSLVFIILSVFSWSLLSCAATATLLSSSQLTQCIDDGSNSLISTCKMKFVVTLAIDGGTSGGDTVLYWNTAVDSASGNAVSLSTPMAITITKSTPVIQYPVFYVRNFNAKPYEETVYTSLFGCSADSISASPTCGRAYTPQGAPILYSEGYCCDCSLCDLVSLCNSDSRANTPCNILGDAEAASCLRFGSQWYSGFSIGQGQRAYTITVNVSTTTTSNASKASSTTLTLGPDALGAVSSSYFGVSARLVGDFSGFVIPWDLTNRMLFVPVGTPSNPLVAAGPGEWMIVPMDMVTKDGTECNKIGVSYAAFNGQGNRCTMAAGSCTRNQLQDLHDVDVAAVAQGRTATYLTSAYGSFVYRTGASSSQQQQPFIAYSLNDIAPSVVTLSFVADHINYTIHVANGTILRAAMTLSSVAANSRDGVLIVEIQNTGWVTSEFQIAVTSCTASQLLIPAQITTLCAGCQYRTTFSVYAQLPEDGAASSCVVTLFDSLYQAVDRMLVFWNTTAVNITDGAQGGLPGSLSGATITSSAMDAVSCPACPWYSPLCFVQQKCFWTLVFTLCGLLLLVAVIIATVKYTRCFTRCCCSTSSEEGSSAPGAPAVITVVSHQRRRRRRERSSSAVKRDDRRHVTPDHYQIG